MSSVSKYFKPAFAKIDALSTRERVIIAITLFVALSFIWSTYVVDKQIISFKSTMGELEKITTGITIETAKQQQLNKAISDDPNIANKLKLERYQQEIERIDALLKEQTYDFISPQQMVGVLRSLVKQESRLQLVELATRGPYDPINGAHEKDQGEGDVSQLLQEEEEQESSGAYVHAIDLQFRGDYMTAMRYVERLEALQWRFIWSGIEIVVEDYPTTLVKLRLETMSFSEGVIGV